MFTALLDASVLWPSTQRDFLLSLAVEKMYRPIWSGAILAELEFHEAAKLRRRGVPADEARSRAEHLGGQMRHAFDDAELTAGRAWRAAMGYQTRTTSMWSLLRSSVAPERSSPPTTRTFPPIGSRRASR